MLRKLCKNFLENHNLINQEELKFTERYFEVILSEKDTILYKQGKKLRYYGQIEKKADEIIKELEIEKFENVEISTLKLFNDYPEKMLEWDIRDEYELHNFLRKILKINNQLEIEFGKMPTLKFGNSNRDMQVLDLLIELSPVSFDDFILEYEKKYGVKKETVAANYVNCISEYLENRVYSIEYEELKWNEQQYLIKTLKKDAYNIEEIRKIYINKFPNGNKKLINSYNLKRLGYKIYYGIVLSQKFNNLEQYHRQILENKDVIDIDSENIIGKATQSFYRVLSILKNEFKIFEFLPNKLISYKKLNNAGIIEEDIKRFIENVYNFGREEIFTIKSLKEKGFKDKLEDLGFEDWFYASLLTSDNRFKFKKLVNTILFRKGNEKVTLGDFIENIIVKYKSIDIYDLQNFLVEYYGIETEKYKILENIKDKNLYYNEIMEKAYIDYDRYLEEV